MSNEIPDDHPIQKVWDNNAKVRTLEGTLEMARNGDKDAITTLMGNVIMKVENGRTPTPEIMGWIAEAFLRIINREPAGVAFGLRPGPGGTKRKLGYKALEKEAEVAHFMISNYDPNIRGSQKTAKLAACKKFGVSESFAQKAYDAYKL